MMANQEQLERLKQGVAVWNAWRIRHVNSRLDLRGVDLREAKLQGTNLKGADLRDADLRDADLRWVNFRETKLQGTDLKGANLEGANLEEASLRDADLRGADLRDAKLRRASFAEATLAGAILAGANLQGADLQGVNLRETNLEGADLSRAILVRVDLFGAFLKGANLTGADVAATTFGALDLREVHGLDALYHGAPSTVGIDTLYESQGDIPEVFLRGCGVPDPMIEFARSLVVAVRPIDYYSCFISYSHANTSFARRLHDALQGRGIRCWLDEHQLLPGHSIFDEVDRGIRLWDKVLLCASEHSLKSWWVDNEIDKAFKKEQQLMKERGNKIRALIPLNLDNALWQWQDGKADQVRSRLAADFTGWEHDNAKFEREFERLVKALQTNEGREEPPTPKL